MRTATLTAGAVEVTCPTCSTSIEAPNGSFLWLVEEVRAVMGKNVECGLCNRKVRVPEAKRVALGD